MNIKISKKIEHNDVVQERINTLLVTTIVLCRIMKITPKKLTQYLSETAKNDKFIAECEQEAVRFLTQKKK